VAAIDMPHGRYLTCTLDLDPDAGGQMRALLLRNRMLVHEAGIRPALLTFRPAPDYAARRAELIARGLLLPEIPLLNIYDHYRDSEWDLPRTTGRELTDLSAHVVRRTSYSDDTPWRTTYRPPGARRLVHDFLRPDGTPFLRIPELSYADPQSWPHRVQAVTKTGEVARTFGSLGHWYRHWLRQLTCVDDRAFVFIDSRHVMPHLVPMRARNLHLIYVLHNIHIKAPRRWDSELVSPVYEQVLDRIHGLDAMVTLTHRQREDIAQRRGATENLFVVPNPVERPQPGAATVRDPRRVAFVARLETQKRPTDAVKAFARVVTAVPEAHLDIYGSGSRARAIEQMIRRLDLEGSVTLHGHDPHARDALWRASAFLMTSSFEGYPLATLESMSHGCPVVAYDIKYGPREQITDDVDGYLVAEGDIEQLAERVVRLLTSPDLAERMSRAATDKARAHDADRFLSDWSRVLEAVIEKKPHRTTLRAVELDVHRLAVRGVRLGPSTPPRRDRSRGRHRPWERLVFDGTLRVRTPGSDRSLDDIRLELAAVSDRTGEVVSLPLSSRRHGRGFQLSCRVPLTHLLGGDRQDEVARLRLRLVWHNSVWQTYLARPQVDARGLEVVFDHEGTLIVRRNERARR
jgi:poly(glycerol-phosphate) alpha-glucosyltransferase